MRFLGFSNHEKGALRQEISKWSMVCNTFSRSGWSVVRSVSLAKGGTSQKRPSLHLHEVPTRSNKVSSRTFRTSLELWCTLLQIQRLKLKHICSLSRVFELRCNSCKSSNFFMFYVTVTRLFSLIFCRDLETFLVSVFWGNMWLVI
jgi:hypothetical protein